jgi:hypothetical protein
VFLPGGAGPLSKEFAKKFSGAMKNVSAIVAVAQSVLTIFDVI